MATSGLAPPGSSTYSSNTMHVGDGTWDASRDDFLLPNIQGLNFDTMRYNGMGNRFRALAEYQPLITAHGTIAAITFIGIVPAAILIARFYYPNPRLALRIHISLQIFTVILSTVVLILGYFAVGPERSLKNPHHGIGVAIYVLVLIQAIGGWLVHKIEKGKMRYHVPIKLMLHQWLGRAIALLALAQIPIGLTLYGSPIALFVLYTLVMTFYLVLYFVLTYQRYKRVARGYDEPGSYVSGTDLTDETREPGHRGRLAALAGAAAGGLGLVALRRRFSNRDSRRLDTDSNFHSRVDSESYLTEKYSDEGREDHTWRNRFLGGAAGLGAVAAARKLFNRRNDKDEDTDRPAYRPPLGGTFTPSTAHVDRLEAGLPGSTEDDQWRRVEEREAAQASAMPHSEVYTGISQGEHSSEADGGNRRGFAAGLTTLAGAVGLGAWLERRRSRRGQGSFEPQDGHHDEDTFRPQEQQPFFNGGGTFRRDGFDPNLPGTALYTHQQSIAPVPPIPSTAGGYGPAVYPYQSQQPQQEIPSALEGPPRSGLGSMAPRPGPPEVVPLTSYHEGAHSDMSEIYNSSNHRPAPFNMNTMGNTINSGPPRSGPRGILQNLQQPLPVASPPRRSSHESYSPGNGASPAVSVKVRTHGDGRHVTLRRLNSEEAAAEREARRLGRPRRGNNGFGSPGYAFSPPPQERGRVFLPATQSQSLGHQPSELDLPASRPPPQPGSPSTTGGLGSSPGTAVTGVAESYDTNRRRRRAERARAEQARLGSSGQSTGRVEFE